MTTLYIKKIIVECECCSQEWVFPRNSACPFCGEPVAFQSIENLDTNQFYTTGSNNPTDDEQFKTREPDSGSKKMVCIGILLGFLMIIAGIFSVKPFILMLQYLDVPVSLTPLLRVATVAIGGYASIRGMYVLANWYSGYRFYRRFRY